MAVLVSTPVMPKILEQFTLDASRVGLNEKGYRRFWRKLAFVARMTSGKVFEYLYYGQYVHRIVMAEACRETYSLKKLDPKTGLPQLPGHYLKKIPGTDAKKKIPRTWSVHHIDGDTDHNCRQNLMLLETVIHDAISVSHQKFLERVQSKQAQLSLIIPNAKPPAMPEE